MNLSALLVVLAFCFAGCVGFAVHGYQIGWRGKKARRWGMTRDFNPEEAKAAGTVFIIASALVMGIGVFALVVTYLAREPR